MAAGEVMRARLTKPSSPNTHCTLPTVLHTSQNSGASTLHAPAGQSHAVLSSRAAGCSMSGDCRYVERCCNQSSSSCQPGEPPTTHMHVWYAALTTRLLAPPTPRGVPGWPTPPPSRPHPAAGWACSGEDTCLGRNWAHTRDSCRSARARWGRTPPAAAAPRAPQEVPSSSAGEWAGGREGVCIMDWQAFWGWAVGRPAPRSGDAGDARPSLVHPGTAVPPPAAGAGGDPRH